MYLYLYLYFYLCITYRSLDVWRSSVIKNWSNQTLGIRLELNYRRCHVDSWSVKLHPLFFFLLRINGKHCLCSSRLHLILSLSGDEEVVENVLQKVKRGPFLGSLLPAHVHYVIELVGAAVRAGHPVHAVHAPDHLWVGHSWWRKCKYSQCQIIKDFWGFTLQLKKYAALVSIQNDEMKPSSYLMYLSF